MQKTHVLVVGGTGMLKPVSLYLTNKDNVVSVIARDKNKLKEAVMLLAESKRPLIIAGQGIRIAKSLDEFKNLAQDLDKKSESRE